MAPDGNPRTNDRPGSNPGSFFNGNRFDNEVESALFVVVISTQEQGSLADAAVVAQTYFRQIVYPDFLPNPYIIADVQ